MFGTVFDELGELLDCERSTLFLLDKETNVLYSEIATDKSGNKLEIKVPVGSGIVGCVAKTGKLANVKNAQLDRRFDPDADSKSDFVTRSVLAIPIYNSDGDVSGVVEVMNKKSTGDTAGSKKGGHATFSSDDESLLQAFCSHIGVAVQQLNAEKDTDLREALRLCKAQKNYLRDVEDLM